PGERLLDVGVLPRLQGEHAGGGVRVIGRRHRHRVDVLRLLVEHLAVVPVPLCLDIGLERVFGALPIDVAQRVDVLAFHAAHVVAARAPHADADDVELVARRAVATYERVPGPDGEGHAHAQ